MTKPGLVVLAGGGHSHALVLRRWAMHPRRRPVQSVLLINRYSTAIYSGMVPGLIAGLYEHEEVAINLRALSDRAGVAFVEAEIIGIDPVAKLLHLKGRPSLRYGLLSLNVGGVTRLSAEGMPIKPLEPALAYLAQQSPEERQPFRVIGAGAAGVEVVLALRRRWPKRPLQLQLRDGQLPDAVERFMRQSQIELITSTIPWSGPSLLCTGSHNPSWLRKSKLPLNHDGRVKTNKCLRVVGHEGIFASGDCAVISGAERPASGVWAVRAAKPLARNLEATCLGETLRQWQPQEHALQLIGNYQGKAWARWWRWRSPAVSLLWKWKKQIDNQFMAKFQLKPMRESSETACRGCAAKLPAEPLKEALERVNLSVQAEDAAELGGKPVQLQSVDGFPAILSDPWLNGRLTTLHACSDLWASGASVTSAMATISLPMIPNEEQEEWLVQTLSGIQTALEEQGAELLGGHTMESRSSPPSPTSLGVQTILTVNGSTNRPWKKSGIKAGDALLLSRELGTGVLFAGAMRGLTPPDVLDEALNKMAQSQHVLLEDLYSLGSSIPACTDVTGFGLLGHLGEMIENQPELTIEIYEEAIPTYDGAISLIEKGINSTIAPHNRRAWRLLDGTVKTKQRPSKIMLELLIDPQTCGPLLVSCDNKASSVLLSTKKWTLIGSAGKLHESN